MMSKNSAQRFLFENADIRGEIISMDSCFTDALAAHGYPQNVRELLGELATAALLLSSTLKFEGILSLQAKGEGPLSLLMVECTDQKTFRALARWEEGADLSGLGLKALLGKGTLVMTIDPHKGNRYQGVVPLHHESLADSLKDYFQQSEQLPTEFWIASNGDQCAGMLLQALPAGVEASDDVREESWNRLSILANTVTSDELLSLDHETLLNRLYHEEDVRLFDEEPVAFNCNCSRPRSAKILHSLGRTEIDAILAESGEVAMDCQFCNQKYVFSETDVAEIFAGQEPKPH